MHICVNMLVFMCASRFRPINSFCLTQGRHENPEAGGFHGSVGVLTPTITTTDTTHFAPASIQIIKTPFLFEVARSGEVV